MSYPLLFIPLSIFFNSSIKLPVLLIKYGIKLLLLFIEQVGERAQIDLSIIRGARIDFNLDLQFLIFCLKLTKIMLAQLVTKLRLLILHLLDFTLMLLL